MDNQVVSAEKPRSRYKAALLVFLGILFLVNAGLLAAGDYFYNVIMTYNLSHRYSAAQLAKEAAAVGFNKKRFAALAKQPVTLDSRYGYHLKGILIRNSQPTKNTVILVHGIGKDKTWSYTKYGDIFLDQGFNLFVYDSVNHGGSGGNHPSYGYYEQDDLNTCVAYVKATNPGGIIGVHGESLGAASALMYAEKYRNKDVSFYIADCGYSDLSRLFSARTVDYKIPKPLRPVLIDYLSLICKARAGFFLGDVSPLRNIDKVTAPVLFIHGDSDKFTPSEMARDLYNRKTGLKRLYYARGADHARSLNVDQKKYRQEITDFLKSVRIGQGKVSRT